MEPSTLRNLGAVCIAVGLLGLAFTLLIAGLVATGSTDPPQTYMVVVVPVQSIVNILVGWTLRRQGTAARR
jgi:hypothetical protein